MIGLLAKPYISKYVSAASDNLAWQSQFPASNMDNNDYGRVAVSTGYSSYLVFDLGVPQPVDVLGLLWHTIPDDCVIVISYKDSNNSSDGWTSLGSAVSKTGFSRRDSLSSFKFLYTHPVPVTARYWRFNLNFVSGAGQPIQISRAFIGLGAKFQIGPQKATLGAKDMNANVTTEIGEQRSQEDPGLIRPVIGLSFEYAKQSEMEQLLGGYTLSLGVSRPILVCSDLTTPYLQDNVAFGRPEKVVTLESSIYDVWSFEAVVTSLGI